MKRYYLLILILAFSCKTVRRDEKEVEKENDLKSYFAYELKQTFPKDGEILILQNQNCSACREDILNKLINHLNKEPPLPKIFIIARNDSSLMTVIKKSTDFRLIIDKNSSLKDYGLNYSADLFFLVKNGQINKWFEISNYVLDTLSKINSK